MDEINLQGSDTDDVQMPDVIGVEQLLEIWGLKHVWPAFKEHNIDLFCLDHIIESDIQNLIPNISDRIKFRFELINYRKLNNPSDDILSPGSTTSVLDFHIGTPSKQIKLSDESSSSCSSSSLNFNNLSTKINIADIIANHGKGLYILKYYNNEKKLDSKCRTNLVEIIIDYYIKTKNGMIKEDFVYIADEIIKQFPKEEKETYYTPAYKNNGIYIPAKGKLIDKFNNVARELRKIGLLSKRRCIAETVTDNSDLHMADLNEIPYDVQENHKLWLLNGKEPWALVEQKWNESYQLRQSFYNNATIENIYKIIDEWPAFKLPLGYKLVEYDFAKLYAGKSEFLFNKWPEFVTKVIPILNCKIKHNTAEKNLLELLINSETLTNEPRDLIIIILLSTILPPTCKIPVKSGTGSKLTWKPTISESKESFILEVKSINDVQHILNERKEKLQHLGLTFQPIIIIIGSATKPEEFIVYFDNIKYKFNSILKAVDVTFKLHQVLNVSYSCECHQIWQFFQKYFFEINTKWDKKLPSILSLISDLK